MKISLLSLVIILFLKCNYDSSNNFSLKISSLNKKIKIDDTINISIDNKNKIKIDSIQFLLNDIEINSNHKLNKANTGEKNIKAIIYHDSEKTILNKKITIFSKSSPKLYKYKVINEFPHDQGAYTQGLEFDGDDLYESTG